MKRTRRIKYCWGASRVVRGKWLLGVICRYERAGNMREEGIAISLRGVLLWLALFGGAAYAAGAGFVLLRWTRNPYLAVTYQDAFFAPIRQAELAQKRGQALLAEGQALFQAKRLPEAADRLRRGLEVRPRDTAARLSLAQIFILNKETSRAERLLREGLGDKFPGRAYLELLFDLAEAAEDHEFIAERSAHYLPELKRDAAHPELRWVMQRRFAALLAGGRAAEALALAETGGGDALAREEQVVALLAAGRAGEAVTRLARWRAQPDVNLRQVLPLEVRALRETRAFEAMDRALEEWRALAPADPAVFSFGVVQLALAGRTEAANAAFDDFVRRFGGQAENLTPLVSALAAARHVRLLQRCVAVAIERGHPPQHAQVALVQALLHQGDWLGAGRALVGIAPETGAATAAPPEWRAWMQGILASAQSQTESADAPIVALLRERPWPIRVLRDSVEALIRAERFAAARDVLARATENYPASVWLKARLAEVKLEIMARTEALPADTALRARVSAEQVFVLRLEDLLRGGKWEEAASHIQQAQAQRPPPAWLAGRLGMIRLAQVRIARERRDFPAMMTAARLYLNGEDERSRRLLELARGYFAAGDREPALSLAREVASREPTDAAAQAVVEEWDPAAARKVAAAARVEAPAVALAGGKAAPGAEAAALLAEMRARAASGELSGMLSSARLFLNGESGRSQQVLDVAREIYATGERAAAIRLVREVGRKSPNFPPATRLLNEWERPARP